MKEILHFGSIAAIYMQMRITRIRLALVLLGGLALLCGGLIGVLGSTHVTSLRKARELVLQQDLLDLRYLIRQYTLDLQKRPNSLNDLVVSGYLKEIPRDPMTRRNDSWTLEWSRGPSMPGIIDIHSGSSAISSKGSAYHDW